MTDTPTPQDYADINSGIVEALSTGSLVLEPNGFPITEVSIVRASPSTLDGPVDHRLARVGKRETVRRAIRKHAEEQAELTDDDPDVLEAYFNKLLEGDLVVVDGPAVRADQLLEDLAHDMRRSAQLRMSDEPRMSTPKKRIAVVGINDHGEAMLDEITVHRYQSEIRTDAGCIQQTVN